LRIAHGKADLVGDARGFDATSQAELPPPTTSTFLPRQSSSTLLKSCECINLPVNLPG